MSGGLSVAQWSSSQLGGGQPSRPAYGSLKDEAARYIREAIVSGALAPRSKVDQDDVAEALGISRAPVREALIELAQKGFVIAVPRRGAFVAELTAEDIHDHYEMLAMVFGMTTKRAVEKLTPSDLLELRQLHREINASDNATRRKDLDRRFFNFIATAGRSPRLDSILQFLGGVYQGSVYYESSRWMVNASKFRQQLLVAIKAGDEQAATQISEDHLRSCATLTIEHLRSRGYWPDAT
jgi:DNA-binding GntR family transcriptional regulator